MINLIKYNSSSSVHSSLFHFSYFSLFSKLSVVLSYFIFLHLTSSYLTSSYFLYHTSFFYQLFHCLIIPKQHIVFLPMSCYFQKSEMKTVKLLSFFFSIYLHLFVQISFNYLFTYLFVYLFIFVY
jgi:hypothetical protein